MDERGTVLRVRNASRRMTRRTHLASSSTQSKGNQTKRLDAVELASAAFGTVRVQGSRVRHARNVSRRNFAHVVAVSEGGVLKLTELIEYKCPATWEKKRHNPNIYKQELVPKLVPTRFRENLLARGEITADGLPLCEGRHRLACPPYYYAQVQYGMQLFKMSGVDLPRAHFVVWCPERTSHIKIERDDTFGKWLIRMLVDVYRHQYAPAIVRQLRGGDRAAKREEAKKQQTPENDPALEFSGFF